MSLLNKVEVTKGEQGKRIKMEEETKKISQLLGCTDSALGPAHPRPTRRDAGTRQGRRRPRVPASSDRVVPRGKARIGPTQSVSACIGRNSRVRDRKSVV